MPKESSLPTLINDLALVVYGVYVTQYLFNVFPPRQGAKILEAGCGSGKFSLSYALSGSEVWAIDIAPDALAHARKLEAALRRLGAKFNIHIRKGSVLKLAFPDNYFDLVFSESVPEHWVDDERRQICINEMTRVSRDSVIVISSNGLNPQQQEVDRTQQFDYVGMSRTRRCFTPGEFQSRMETAGLVNIKILPIGKPSPLRPPTPEVVSISEALELAAFGKKKGADSA